MITTVKETIKRDLIVCNICELPAQTTGQFLPNFPDTHYHYQCLLNHYLKTNEEEKGKRR